MAERDEDRARGRDSTGRPTRGEAAPLRLALAVGGVVTVAGLLLVLLADGYVAHGLDARWMATHEGERVEITRTVEHRTTFPNVHRPLARYVQGWPHERVPRPEALPRLDAVLSARLEVPAGGRHLRAESPNQVRLEIDGEPYEEAAQVAAGSHRLRVRWQGRPGRQRPDAISLQLLWGPSAEADEPIPRAALRPASDWPTSRVWLWVLGPLFALGFGALLTHAAMAPSGRARRRRVGRAATLAILVLGTGLRLFDYDVMPEFRENADELFATWNGWSLVEDGTTRGWSLWPGAYGDAVVQEQVRFFGEERTVISPYFEHPPLLHVLVGVAAHLGGANHWLDAKLAHTRLVPIGLSALTLFLMVGLGRRLFPRDASPWLGALLYAALPTIALQTRVVKEEALLVPLMLGGLWLFLLWRDEGRRTWHLVLAAALMGLAAGTKVPGAVLALALAMLIAAEPKGTKSALAALAIGAAAASLLFVFAALIDWRVFWMTQAKQGTRPTHWNLFPRFFDVTLINHNIVGRGYLLFLWAGTLSVIFRRSFRDAAVLSVPLVVYLGAIAIGSGNWTFGWYILPLYPLLCLGAGAFLAELWARPTLLGGTLFVVLLVMYGLNFTLDPEWAKAPQSWPSIRRMVTLTAAVSLAPFAAAQVWRRSELIRGLARGALVFGLAAVVALGAHFVVSYDVVYERYRNFDRDSYFDR